MQVRGAQRLPYYGGKYPRVHDRTTREPDVEDEPVVSEGRVRRGGCVPLCGACCEAMIIPLDPRMLQSPRLADWIKWAEFHGCKVMVDNKRGWFDLWIPKGCKELRYDARCGLVVNGVPAPSRPDMCGRYPQTESELVGVEHVCRFRFEPLRRRREERKASNAHVE